MTKARFHALPSMSRLEAQPQLSLVNCQLSNARRSRQCRCNSSQDVNQSLNDKFPESFPPLLTVVGNHVDDNFRNIKINPFHSCSL